LIVWGELPLLLVLVAGAGWVWWRRGPWLAVGGLTLQVLAILGGAAWWHYQLELIENGSADPGWSTFVEWSTPAGTSLEVAELAGMAMLAAAIFAGRSQAGESPC
jgi:hypothetical protein